MTVPLASPRGPLDSTFAESDSKVVCLIRFDGQILEERHDFHDGVHDTAGARAPRPSLVHDDDGGLMLHLGHFSFEQTERRRRLPSQAWHGYFACVPEPDDIDGALAKLERLIRKLHEKTELFESQYRATSFIASRAALIVLSTSRAVCAPDRNHASNCDGGGYTPRASRPLKKTPYFAASARSAV